VATDLGSSAFCTTAGCKPARFGPKTRISFITGIGIIASPSARVIVYRLVTLNLYFPLVYLFPLLSLPGGCASRARRRNPKVGEDRALPIRKMPYVNSDGTVSDRRTWFRFSLITDALWAVVNFVGLFFDTLVNPTKKITPRRVDGGNGTSRTSNYTTGGATGEGTTRPPRGSNIKGLPKASEQPACGPGGG